MASALRFALNWSYGPSDTNSTDNIEVISQTRIQPTYSNYSLIYKQTASGATTNSLLILNSVYKKHMWHLKTFRKQTKKSSLLSPPCLDGTAAFPNSKTAPMKRMMPRDGGGAGAALASRDGEERQGLPVDVTDVTSVHPTGTWHWGSAGVCHFTCHRNRQCCKWPPGTAADNLPMGWRCTGVGDTVTDNCGQQLCPRDASTDIMGWNPPLIFVCQWRTHFFK